MQCTRRPCTAINCTTKTSIRAKAHWPGDRRTACAGPAAALWRQCGPEESGRASRPGRTRAGALPARGRRLLQVAVQECGELALGEGTDLGRYDGAIAEQHERRDAANAVPG